MNRGSLPAATADVLLDETTEIVVVCDNRGRIAAVGSAALRALAIPADALMSKTWRQVGLPGDLSDRLEASRVGAQAARRRQAVIGDFPAPGTWHIVPIAGGNGDVDAVLFRFVPSDPIRERGPSLYRTILDGIADAVFAKDLQGRYLLINEAGARQLGRTVAEVIGRDDSELLGPETARGTIANDRKVLHGGRPMTYVSRADAAGVERVYLSTKWVFRDPSGAAAGIIGVARDITEQKRVERALREREDTYRMLADYSTDIISRHDPAGVYLYVSPACRSLLGYEPDDLLGRSAYDFIHPDDRARIGRTHATVLASDQPSTVSFRIRTKAGRYVWFETTSRTLRDKSTGQVAEIHCASRDVTARRRGERLLRRQNRKLQALVRSERAAKEALGSAERHLGQTEKLAALGQMVAGVAHEINNPLAFVTNNVAVLRRDVGFLRDLLDLYAQAEPALAEHRPDLHGEIRALADRIDLAYTLRSIEELSAGALDGLSRIGRIVGDLRDFARLDEDRWEEADLNEGIRTTVNVLAGPARDRGVSLLLDAGHLPAVGCYPGKINQVVLNLVANALDACEGGGTVTVRTRATADTIEIHVIDTGRGIEPDVLRKIFDPFFTTKPIGRGTGLGLSISYGIVQAHGGRIDVETSPGQGAHFTVRLPLAGGALSEAAAGATAPGGGKE